MRLDIARSRGVPPYVIFHDVTLREMARLRPASVDALLAVKGVGARKADDLGDLFLAAIRASRVQVRACRLVSLERVSIAYGHLPLLDDASLQIEPRERVCVIGRNGTGKSTLLRIISGELAPEAGGVWQQPGLRIGSLAQDVPLDDPRPVSSVVSEGVKHLGDVDEWRKDQLVDVTLTRLGLPPDASVQTLSGGWRRRVLLARALVGQPDLLLLDEPTNHLDIEAMTWLESFLVDYPGAVVFVTHDRVFLQHVATRIVELDRGRLTSWPGDYETFLAQERGVAGERSRAAREVRQAARRGRGLAAPGHQGAAHAQ